MSYVNKYIKNLKPSDLQLSLWGGDVVLSKLDLRLDVLEQVLWSVLAQPSLTFLWKNCVCEPVPDVLLKTLIGKGFQYTSCYFFGLHFILMEGVFFIVLTLTSHVLELIGCIGHVSKSQIRYFLLRRTWPDYTAAVVFIVSSTNRILIILHAFKSFDSATYRTLQKWLSKHLWVFGNPFLSLIIFRS